MRGYDFEVLDEEINENKRQALMKENTIKERVKRYKLKRWVKVVIWTLFVVFITLAIYQLFTKKTIHTTPVGTYECHGGIIQVCSGSKEVADYLGV